MGYIKTAEFHFICITFMTPLPIGAAVVFHCFGTNGLIHQPYHEFHPVGNLLHSRGDIGTPFMKALEDQIRVRLQVCHFQCKFFGNNNAVGLKKSAKMHHHLPWPKAAVRILASISSRKKVQKV